LGCQVTFDDRVIDLFYDQTLVLLAAGVGSWLFMDFFLPEATVQMKDELFTHFTDLTGGTRCHTFPASLSLHILLMFRQHQRFYHHEQPVFSSSLTVRFGRIYCREPRSQFIRSDGHEHCAGWQAAQVRGARSSILH
jgi:hypothetical protein